jgi:hypothetical protein
MYSGSPWRVLASSMVSPPAVRRDRFTGIEVGERLAVGVDDFEAAGQSLHGPGRREAISHGARFPQRGCRPKPTPASVLLCQVGYQQCEQEYRAHKSDPQEKAVDGILVLP